MEGLQYTAVKSSKGLVDLAPGGCKSQTADRHRAPPQGSQRPFTVVGHQQGKVAAAPRPKRHRVRCRVLSPLDLTTMPSPMMQVKPVNQSIGDPGAPPIPRSNTTQHKSGKALPPPEPPTQQADTNPLLQHKLRRTRARRTHCRPTSWANFSNYFQKKKQKNLTNKYMPK